jgi:hypothetical protein
MTTTTTMSTMTMMEEGASGRMGKTGQIRAGGGKKGRVNEVIVGIDEDDDDEEEEEEEEEDAALPGPTSPEAASDDDVPSKSKRTAAASRFVNDEAEDGGGGDDDDDDDNNIQYDDVVEIPAKANDDAKDDRNDDYDEMSGGDGDVDFGPRDDPIDFDGPRAAADPRPADRPRHQRQSPFSPSSTPLDEPRRILCWNHVGVVTLRNDDATSGDGNNLVDIAFHETAGLAAAENVPSPSRTTWASSSTPSARRGGCLPPTSRRTTSSTTTGRTTMTSPGWGSCPLSRGRR